MKQRRNHKNPQHGYTNPDEGWRRLCINVLSTAADDYYRARVDPSGLYESEAEQIQRFLLDPENPWTTFAGIDPELHIDILARIDEAIENEEHYNVKYRLRA